MSTAVTGTEQSGDPVHHLRSVIWWLRPAVLIVAGLVIAFSAELHAELLFDRIVVGIALLVIAITHVIEWRTVPKAERTPVPVLLAAVAVIAAILVLVLNTVLGFALVIAAWALITGLLEFLSIVLGASSRVDGIVYGALGILLSILVLLVVTDIIAVTGFFGAYVVILGVYLAISVFDMRSRAKREHAEAAAAEETAESSASDADATDAATDAAQSGRTHRP